MLPRVRKLISSLTPWWRYCRLLVFLFLLRGIVLLCVLPPFEGWDEYQHLAYAAILVEEGRAPVLGDGTQVPEWMYPALAKFPHSALGAEQVRIVGGQTYQEYWSQAERLSTRPTGVTVPLYQSQHPTLYYRLIAPVVRMMSPTEDVRSLVGVLRWVNVLLGAAAVYLVLWGIGRLTTLGPHRYLMGILVATQPLFLVNCARVANDALAVMLGTAAIVVLLVSSRSRYWATTFCGGAALGLSVLAKTVNLGLVPFSCVAAVWSAWQQNKSWKQPAVAVAILLVPAVAITYPYFRFNVMQHGMLSPMQEAVRNREEGRTWRDAVATAGEIDWADELGRRFFRRSLWAGAWSFLSAPRWMYRIYEYSYYLAAAGFLFSFSRRVRHDRNLFAQRDTTPMMALLCVSMAAGLAYHMIHSKMQLGAISTNAWYAAVVFPWMICLACQGLAYLPWRWCLRLSGGAMAMIFLLAEVHGVFFRMIPLYTQSSQMPVSVARLAALHPSWLQPSIGAAAFLIAMLSWVFAAAIWIGAERSAHAQDASRAGRN